MMTPIPNSLSIIIPTYNEIASLPEVLLKVSALIDALDVPAKCIIIDDGSVDESRALLAQAATQYDWLEVVILERQQGKSAALAAGLAASSGDTVLMIDGDLQNDPMDFPAMLRAMQEQGMDMMVGWRKQRKDGSFKHLASSIYNGLLNKLLGMDLHDHNCGMKVLKREIIQTIPLAGEWHRYLTVLSHYAGYRVGEIVIRHHPRLHGQSRYGVGRYIQFICDLPLLCIHVRRLKRRSKMVEHG